LWSKQLKKSGVLVYLDDDDSNSGSETSDNKKKDAIDSGENDNDDRTQRVVHTARRRQHLELDEPTSGYQQPLHEEDNILFDPELGHQQKGRHDRTHRRRSREFEGDSVLPNTNTTIINSIDDNDMLIIMHQDDLAEIAAHQRKIRAILKRVSLGPSPFNCQFRGQQPPTNMRQRDTVPDSRESIF
jgi:homoserine acetyltransferase